MEFKQLNDKIDNLNKLIANHQLGELFKAVNRTIDDNKVLLQLKDKVRKQLEIYNNLLKYSFTTVKDPERDNIYSKILVSLYLIIDEIKLALIEENKHWAINTYRHETNFEFATNHGIIEKGILSPNLGRDSDLFFKKIWISGKLNIDDASVIEKLLKSKKVSWITESLIVSALTISSIMNFDEQKLKFLFDFYFKGTAKVWQKAIVGIVLNVHFYSSRLKEYPELLKLIELIRKEKDFFNNLEYIILQLVRTKETDKISKKLHDEIIPEVAKLKPKIEEKLKLDDILKEQFGEDKNPDWELVFEDSPKLLSKLEEFSKMQIEGSDVFMSAFALLTRIIHSLEYARPN